MPHNANTARRSSPAAEKILASAMELFYEQGIHTVGIDRIIATARVTKATFYRHFPSKDSLVAAYIARCDVEVRDQLARSTPDKDSARNTLAALVEGVIARINAPKFRGCAFISAVAQFPDARHAVRQAVAIHRDWYLEQIEILMRQAGHPAPGDAADDFLLAHDGALSGAGLGDPVAACAALRRSLAGQLAQAA